MKQVIFFFLCISLSAAAAPLKSSHLKNFSIQQCSEKGCFKASGDLAFVSKTNDSLAAGSVLLEISGPRGEIHQRTRCDSFDYNLKTQFLTCDNHDLVGVPSLTINSQYLVSIF